MDEFVFMQNDQIVQLHVDSMGNDYDGLKLVAESFADDVQLVTGVKPKLETELADLNGYVLFAGSIGNHALIDSFIREQRIDISPIRNKRETFMIRVVEQPLPHVERALVIVGSDKRGTIYGVYEISALIGVSPWVYWGDVEPARVEELRIPVSRLQMTSKEPSVRYRGIFINDEWPSFGTWTTHRYGGFNEEMYRKVFELILRLKGNFMWPAMWSAIFSEDGKRSPLANAELAHAYGIIIGTSHHEPMFRAGEEWQKIYRNYTNNNLWDFTVNREAIVKFWEDGVIRNKDFENVITLGMRGERDSALGGGLEENIERLKDIITVQKKILDQYGLANAPQVLTIYKEVEHFWHGTDEVPGLKHWDKLDDVTIMLADDNFGNVRTLPTAEERDRKAGWGMYYHFDYHGGPKSYEWVNTIPLEKIWEQMSMAYDYGVRELWIVNVGDLKPMELPISYFMDLAYDFDTWGASGIHRMGEYTLRWVRQQFGHIVSDEAVEGIAQILAQYTKLNGARKPEVTYADTYSLANFNEAKRVFTEVSALEEKAKRYGEMVSEAAKDTYYQLVFYPAVASANVKKMQIYAGLNEHYRTMNPPSVLANEYAQYVQQAIEKDQQMQEYYNDTMSGGKWKGMMSEPHIGYVNWNSEGWQYPHVEWIIPQKGSVMIVEVEGSAQGYVSGTAALPVFTNLKRERYGVTISNGGDTPFTYRIQTVAPWIQVDSFEGTVQMGRDIQVQIDWELLLQSANNLKPASPSKSACSFKSLDSYMTITGAGQTVRVNIIAEWIKCANLPSMTFVETHGVIAIEAEHTAQRIAKNGVEWKTIEQYGRTLSSVKMFPTTIAFDVPEEAPYLEYNVLVANDGEYTLTLFCAPTNPLYRTHRLKYAVGFEGQLPQIAEVIPDGYQAGESKSWENAVTDNIHLSVSTHFLKTGFNTLRIYGLDAGLVLQKLVLSKGPLADSYFGPEESYYI